MGVLWNMVCSIAVDLIEINLNRLKCMRVKEEYDCSLLYKENVKCGQILSKNLVVFYRLRASSPPGLEAPLVKPRSDKIRPAYAKIHHHNTHTI